MPDKSTRPAGLPQRIKAWWWKALKAPATVKRAKPALFWAWRKWRLAKPKPKPQPVVNPVKPGPPIAMFDDVNVSLLPINAKAYAAYVDGHWPNYALVVKNHPHAQHVVSIAVLAKDDADALDVEPGDATIAQAAAWVKRQHAKGHRTPIVYTSLAWGEQLIAALAKAGLHYGVDYLWWSAHYTGHPHICNPKDCGLGLQHVAHATQWTDKVAGKSLDESLCRPAFFGSGKPV